MVCVTSLFPYVIIVSLFFSLLLSFVKARIQSMHIAKKFYSKPELAMRIEVCIGIPYLFPIPIKFMHVSICACVCAEVCIAEVTAASSRSSHV